MFPSVRPTRIVGTLITGNIGPEVSAGLSVVWTITTATAPAFCAFSVWAWLVHAVAVSTTAIAPAGRLKASQPSFGAPVPSLTSTSVPGVPAVVAGGL